MVKDGIEGNPILGGLEMLGFNAQEYLGKNPRLLAQIMPLLKGALGKRNSPGQDAGGLGGYG